MTSFSPAKGAAATKSYHAKELVTGDREIDTDRQFGQWTGRLAEAYGLTGEVHQVHADRLAEGRHPHTNELLIRSQPPRTYTTKNGTVKTSMTHRSSWEVLIDPDKSVSLTATQDPRVAQVHRDAATVAFTMLEKYAQAHSTGGRVAEETGNVVAARYSHQEANPVNGYRAPHYHEHFVVYNMTMNTQGEIKPLELRGMLNQQKMAGEIYQRELKRGLEPLGYELQKGQYHQWQIKGYSAEILRAESPRRQQIEKEGHSPFAQYQQRGGHTKGSQVSPHAPIIHAVVQQAMSNQQAKHLAQGLASIHNAQTHAAVTKALAPHLSQRQPPVEPEKTHGQAAVRGSQTPRGKTPNQHRHNPGQVPGHKPIELGIER